LTEYEKRKVKSIAKDDVNPLDSEIEKKKLQKLKEMYKPLTSWWKKRLGKNVENVVVTNKLVDDPVFILTSQYGYSASMEKINRAQAFANQEKAANYMLAKKTLEINPHHPIMKQLLQQVKEHDGELGAEEAEYTDLIYNLALLNSGFFIEDPTEIQAPMQRLLKLGFGISKDAAVETIEVELSSEEEEELQEIAFEDEEGEVEQEMTDDEEPARVIDDL
jgi:heat shock protein beta